MNTFTQDRPAEKLRTHEELKGLGAAGTQVVVSPSDTDLHRVRNILAVLNSAASSHVVLEHARLFAELFGARITIVYSVEPGSPLVSPRELQEQMARTAGVQADQIRATMVRRGTTSFLQIANAARTENADIIIIAGDFNLGLSRFFQNSAIEKLIHHAPCPVLVVCKRESQGCLNGRLAGAKALSSK